MQWLTTAKERWNDKFLGIYLHDEIGGKQLEEQRYVPNASDYADAANKFVENIVSYNSTRFAKNNSIPLFTSDYALYWWDYQAGFDVILTQLGWNHSIAQQIDLSRAAANMQNKTWGAIITYKNTVPPYLDSADNIYSQMLQAYESGAKYIAIFNYPTYPDDNQYGILTDQDFEALQNFWNHITSPTATSADPDYSHADIALVLPRNYGFGLRDPLDRVWGYWSADELSPQVWNVTQVLVERYGLSLDIVYDDPAFPFAGRYSQVYLWNQTITAIPAPISIQPRFP
jgi:hypothetical protein